MAENEKTEYWFKGTPAEFGAIAEDLSREKHEGDPDLSASPYMVTEGLEPFQGTHFLGPNVTRRRILPDANPVRIRTEYWNGVRRGDGLVHNGTLEVTATAIPGKGTRLRLGPVHMLSDDKNPDQCNDDPAPVLAMWGDLLDELVQEGLIDDGETAEPTTGTVDRPDRKFYDWAYVEIEMKGRDANDVFDEYMRVIQGVDVFGADALLVDTYRNRFDSAMSSRRKRYAG